MNQSLLLSFLSLHYWEPESTVHTATHRCLALYYQGFSSKVYLGHVWYCLIFKIYIVLTLTDPGFLRYCNTDRVLTFHPPSPQCNRVKSNNLQTKILIVGTIFLKLWFLINHSFLNCSFLNCSFLDQGSFLNRSFLNWDLFLQTFLQLLGLKYAVYQERFQIKSGL